MANVVIDMRDGTVLEKATSPTSSTEPRDRETLNQTSSGVAGSTIENGTLDRSGARLSDAERMRVAKIKWDIEHGFLFSFQDAIFLLEMVERVNR